MKTRFSLLLLCVLCIGLTRCDFTHVEEAARTPVEELVLAVAEADTPERAEVAITNLFRKAEVGIDWKEGAFSQYAFTHESLKKLAAMQARYVRGDESAGQEMEAIYARILDAQRRVDAMEHPIEWAHDTAPITASFDQVTLSFRASLRGALAQPELPANTLLFAIAAGPDGRVSEAWFDEDAASEGGALARQKLSPTQSALYGIWVHKFGPACSANKRGGGSSSSAGGTIKNECPTGYDLIAKFEWSGGSWVFEKPSGNGTVITMGGDDDTATWSIDTSTGFEVDWVQFKASTDITGYSTVGQTSGVVEKDQHGLSNIIYCGHDFAGCIADCDAALQTCLASAGTEGEEEACYTAYSECDQGCHNQGGGTGD